MLIHPLPIPKMLSKSVSMFTHLLSFYSWKVKAMTPKHSPSQHFSLLSIQKKCLWGRKGRSSANIQLSWKMCHRLPSAFSTHEWSSRVLHWAYHQAPILWSWGVLSRAALYCHLPPLFICLRFNLRKRGIRNMEGGVVKRFCSIFLSNWRVEIAIFGFIRYYIQWSIIDGTVVNIFGV